jgi:hypothetical protein
MYRVGLRGEYAAAKRISSLTGNQIPISLFFIRKERQIKIEMQKNGKE